jgi:hypothetical protein
MLTDVLMESTAITPPTELISGRKQDSKTISVNLSSSGHAQHA